MSGNARRCSFCRRPIIPPLFVIDACSRVEAASALAGFCTPNCMTHHAANTVAAGEAWWQGVKTMDKDDLITAIFALSMSIKATLAKLERAPESSRPEVISQLQAMARHASNAKRDVAREPWMTLEMLEALAELSNALAESSRAAELAAYDVHWQQVREQLEHLLTSASEFLKGLTAPPERTTDGAA